MSSQRRRCFFDVTIDGDLAGRIVFELYDDITPDTAENFLQLCTGQAGIGKTTGKPLSYKGTAIHRVVKNFMIQGGDFSAGNGSGGESIYGGTFDDENFTVKHDQPFILSMANRGPNTNGSQFFVTTNSTPHLNDVHVAFGRVVSGQEVVTKIEQLKTGGKSRPLNDVVIANCGQLIKKSKGDEGSDEEVNARSKKEKKKRHKRDSTSSSSSEDEKKKEEEGTNGVNLANISSVRKEDLPEVPETNKFLMRDARSPKKEAVRASGDSRRDRRSRSLVRSRNRNGTKVKGRGRLTYRSPSRDGSVTPPHWKQEQRRLLSISELQRIQKEQREIAERQAAREERHRLEEEERKKQREAQQPPPSSGRASRAENEDRREPRRESPSVERIPEERRSREEGRNGREHAHHHNDHRNERRYQEDHSDVRRREVDRKEENRRRPVEEHPQAGREDRDCDLNRRNEGRHYADNRSHRREEREREQDRFRHPVEEDRHREADVSDPLPIRHRRSSEEERKQYRLSGMPELSTLREAERSQDDSTGRQEDPTTSDHHHRHPTTHKTASVVDSYTSDGGRGGSKKTNEASVSADHYSTAVSAVPPLTATSVNYATIPADRHLEKPKEASGDALPDTYILQTMSALESMKKWEKDRDTRYKRPQEEKRDDRRDVRRPRRESPPGRRSSPSPKRRREDSKDRRPAYRRSRSRERRRSPPRHRLPPRRRSPSPRRRSPPRRERSSPPRRSADRRRRSSSSSSSASRSSTSSSSSSSSSSSRSSRSPIRRRRSSSSRSGSPKRGRS